MFSMNKIRLNVFIVKDIPAEHAKKHQRRKRRIAILLE